MMNVEQLKASLKCCKKVYGWVGWVQHSGCYFQLTKKDVLLELDHFNDGAEFRAEVCDNVLYID